MADAPPTGAPGLFQKKGGTRQQDSLAPSAGQESAVVPPQQTVQLLGLISRIQLLEGSLSQLRREKLLSEQDASQLVEPPTDQERAAAAALLLEVESLEGNISIMEGIIRNVIDQLRSPPPGIFSTSIVGGSPDQTRSQQYRARLQATLLAAIGLPPRPPRP